MGVKLACMALTAPHGQARGHGGPQSGQSQPEADLLAFHVAVGRVDARRVQHRRAGRFRRIGDGDACHEQDAHHPDQGARLPAVADEAAEGEDDGDRDHQHLPDLDEVRQRRRVLEGMGGIHVEEAAAIGAELLDRDLAGDRPERDGLLGTLERRGVDRGAAWSAASRAPRAGRAVTRDERQKDVEGRAGHIDPEVADRPRLGAGEAADQRHRQGKARGGGEEVLHRQPGHLREVAHGGLAAIGLPVRVGDERDGGVEGEIRREGAKALRVERQDSLAASGSRRAARSRPH